MRWGARAWTLWFAGCAVIFAANLAGYWLAHAAGGHGSAGLADLAACAGTGLVVATAVMVAWQARPPS